MIILAAAVLGGVLGLLTARRYRGDRKDKLQYVAVYGLIFAVIGTIVTVVIERMAT